MARMVAFAALLAVAVAVTSVCGIEVTSLPGLNGPLPTKMYSGYMTLNATTGRETFYMFFESANPTTDPIALWLTGGPGCSGLMAAFTENGPLQMNFSANGQGIQVNPYSWTNAMSMIYIESPVGVGFSHVPGQTEYVTGDQQTADDTYAFLQGFFQEFPQFKKNDFWVTGESYGGHYVPEIVDKILDENAVVSKTGNFKLPLKGWMAGNPWTFPEVEAFGVVQNWWDRAIIGAEDWQTIQAACNFEEITFWIINNASAGSHRTAEQQKAWWNVHLKLAQANGQFTNPGSNLCFQALYEASDVQFNKVDILGVYRDMCVPGVKQLPDQINPCAATQMQEYLNIPAVRQAIGASLTSPTMWTACSAPPQLTYSTVDTQHSVLPIYQRAINSTDLAILVYSGDNDAIVPFTGTRKWLAVLDRPVINRNHQWFSDTNGMQVGGWATQYDRLTFATVRGAGHMVPYMEPKRSLTLVQEFLKNKKL